MTVTPRVLSQYEQNRWVFKERNDDVMWSKSSTTHLHQNTCFFLFCPFTTVFNLKKTVHKLSGELENLYTANTQHNNMKCQFQWFWGSLLPSRRQFDSQQELFSHSKWRQIKTIFKPCFLTLSWIRDLSVLSHAFCSRRHTRKCVVCAGTGSPWEEIKEPYHQKAENDSDSY